MSFDTAFQWPDDGRSLHCGLKMLNNRHAHVDWAKGKRR